MTDITAAALEIARKWLDEDLFPSASEVVTMAKAIRVLHAENTACESLAKAAERCIYKGYIDHDTGDPEPCAGCHLRIALDSYRAKVQR